MDSLNKSAIIQLLNDKCTQVSLDPKALQAIITIESSWNPYVYRYEPTTPAAYLQTPDLFAKKNVLSQDSETMFQMTSFGLAQIMGYNFRDLGFTGPLGQAFDPETNITYMVLFYKKSCAKYMKLEDQISTYNKGNPKKLSNGLYSNQDYVTKVMNIYKILS